MGEDRRVSGYGGIRDGLSRSPFSRGPEVLVFTQLPAYGDALVGSAEYAQLVCGLPRQH